MSVICPASTVCSMFILVCLFFCQCISVYSLDACFPLCSAHVSIHLTASAPWNTSHPEACWQTSFRTPCAPRWPLWCGWSFSGPSAGSAALPAPASPSGCGTGLWRDPSRSLPSSTGEWAGGCTAWASRSKPQPGRPPVELWPLEGCWWLSAGRPGSGFLGCCSGRPSFHSGLHLEWRGCTKK